MDIEKIIREFEEELTILDKIEIKLYRSFGGIYDFFRYDLIQGLKNFWRYRKVIWRHRWYDYGFADDVVHEMYKERAEKWHMNHYVNGDKDEVELKIIAELFNRMENIETFTVEYDEEDIIRKEIYRRIARKRYWD